MLIGFAGGLGAGLANYVAEAVALAVCIRLEKQGVIRRFIPGTAPLAEHPPSNLFAVGLPYTPLYCAISLGWTAFGQRAVPDFHMLNIWSFVIVAMLCHDAWFFILHTVLHKVRRLYKHVHSMHHRLRTTCSALGTAYADAIDVGLCFVGFHAALYVYLSHQRTWNPVAVVALIVVEEMANIVGESLLKAYGMHVFMPASLWLESRAIRLFILVVVPLFLFLPACIALHCMLHQDTCCGHTQSGFRVSAMLSTIASLEFNSHIKKSVAKTVECVMQVIVVIGCHSGCIYWLLVVLVYCLTLLTPRPTTFITYSLSTIEPCTSSTGTM